MVISKFVFRDKNKQVSWNAEKNNRLTDWHPEKNVLPADYIFTEKSNRDIFRNSRFDNLCLWRKVTWWWDGARTPTPWVRILPGSPPTWPIRRRCWRRRWLRAGAWRRWWRRSGACPWTSGSSIELERCWRWSPTDSRAAGFHLRHFYGSENHIYQSFIVCWH